MNQDTEHGTFGKLAEGDQVKVTLHDDTVITGRVRVIQSSHHKYVGGFYITKFYVDWDAVRWLDILSRPTAEEKFTAEVADRIKVMMSNLGGQHVQASCGTVAINVIRMVREHDAKRTEVTKVEGPARVIDHGNHQHVVTAQVEARPAHQDRLSNR